MRLRWTTPAAQALEGIQDYIAKDNPRAAHAVTQRIRSAVDNLEQHPKIGRAGRIRGIYELVIPGTPYIVPYRIRNDDIEILSIYHASRRWPEAFD